MATVCFERAGDSYWEKKSKAASLRATAIRLHDLNSEDANAILREAAEIFEGLGIVESAAQCFSDLGDYERAGKIFSFAIYDYSFLSFSIKKTLGYLFRTQIASLSYMVLFCALEY
jgi:hypothetical protein